jgi:hypothetical protein
MEEQIADIFQSERLQRAAVRVWSARPDRGGQFLGTAFFISRRQALTAKHVLDHSGDEAPLLQLSWMGGIYAPVSRVFRAAANVDAALLEIGEEAAAPADAIVAIPDAIPLTPGAPLLIDGFGDAATSLEIRPATVTGLDPIANARIIIPPPAKGMSGGPALSPDGLLRGIIWARDMDQLRGYLTPLSAFRPLLAEVAMDAAPARLRENPALGEDRRRLSAARALLLQWRGRYSPRLAELQAAAEMARKLQRWSGDPPYREARKVADLALSVVEAMTDLPVAELEFATHYGLGVHRTMFGGYALFLVRADQGRLEGRDTAEQDPYAYEMMARVLESAIALLEFQPSALPQGFIAPAVAMDGAVIRSTSSLLLARPGEAGALQLISMEPGIAIVGGLAARPKPLLVDAARRMADGAVEALARDFQYRYRWVKDEAWPAAQYEDRTILFATFPSSAPGSSPIVGGSDGSVDELYLDGSSHRLVEANEDRKFIAGAAWSDPDDPESVYVVHVAGTGEMRALRLGDELPAAERDFASSLANPPESGLPAFLANQRVEIDILDVLGFPCAMVTAHLALGTVLLFVDPKSLQPIRPALRLTGKVQDCTIVADRWLVVSYYGVRQDQPLVTVHDLAGSAEAAVGALIHPGAEIADVYDGCRVYFVRMFLGVGARRRLIKWSWPEQALDEFSGNDVEGIFPVSL